MTRLDLAFTLLGIALVAAGAHMIYPPSAWIVAGVGVIVLSVWPERR